MGAARLAATVSLSEIGRPLSGPVKRGSGEVSIRHTAGCGHFLPFGEGVAISQKTDVAGNIRCSACSCVHAEL